MWLWLLLLAFCSVLLTLMTLKMVCAASHSNSVCTNLRYSLSIYATYEIEYSRAFAKEIYGSYTFQPLWAYD